MPITPLLDWTKLVKDPRDKRDRHFNGPVWKLSEIQEHVALKGHKGISLITDQAQFDLQNALRWTMNDLCGFIGALLPHRYDGSQMCYASGKSTMPYASDAYVMGYNHIKKVEWQERIPYTYIKFPYYQRAQMLFVFSIHPEKDKNDRR